jgi:hypothetical protein
MLPARSEVVSLSIHSQKHADSKKYPRYLRLLSRSSLPARTIIQRPQRVAHPPGKCVRSLHWSGRVISRRSVAIRVCQRHHACIRPPDDCHIPREQCGKQDGHQRTGEERRVQRLPLTVAGLPRAVIERAQICQLTVNCTCKGGEWQLTAETE